MTNATGPQAAFYGQGISFGYPEGLTIVDFVPDTIKHMVHEHWYSFPPVNPMWHYLLGAIYIILGFFSITGNGIVIYLFIKATGLRTPANLLVVNLALSDLIMLTTNFPPFAYNCFSGGQWMFNAFFCELYAALGAITGVCSIWTLGMISWDRYNIICNGFNGPKMTMTKAVVMCLFCWAMAIGWALPPFFGWGKYIPEGILDSCSYDYLTQDWNTKSYNIAIFIFDFFLPASIIICSYVFIVKAICAHEAGMRAQAKKMNVSNLRSNEADNQRAEIRIAKTAIANVSLWLTCWTPYAAITIQGVLGHHENITPLVTMLPALLAKSASCYNPFVYAISHPKFRQALTVHLPWFCVHETQPKNDDSKSVTSNTTANDEKA
ncbi:compound eye opsin BCRH1-like isoform X1 [Homarus americanus]|uniref:compound eye opsin BCRH1-like isoform X1 n=1 Tax=Homarus americanus TaxID=6706 RepID=UPI001C4603D1|nr:compound eye opsin BCRH1-like isoform X1 [Homarus americanus]